MIFITGASSGIGEACAEKFAAEKKPLILTARRKDRLNALAKRLHEKYGVECHVFELDVSRKEQVEKLAREQGFLLSQVTVLLNNAGLARGLAPIQEGATEDWDEMIDVNIKGLLYVTKAILPFMLQKKDGHIINLGSIAGSWAYPKGNVYCATKSAVSMLNEAMRLDLHGSGIRVTEISPGMVKTDFSLVRLKDQEKADAVYAKTNPLTAEDIAETVAWCASRPKHVNVQELVIYPTDQAAPGLVLRT